MLGGLGEGVEGGWGDLGLHVTGLLMLPGHEGHHGSRKFFPEILVVRGAPGKFWSHLLIWTKAGVLGEDELLAWSHVFFLEVARSATIFHAMFLRIVRDVKFIS